MRSHEATKRSVIPQSISLQPESYRNRRNVRSSQCTTIHASVTKLVRLCFHCLLKINLEKINEIRLSLSKLAVTYEFIKKVPYKKNLIVKANEMHYFSNLFDKVLCFRQVHCPSSGVSRHCIYAIGICHDSSVGVC